MKYTVTRNGIWGVRALDVREFNGGTGVGLFEQMQNAQVYDTVNEQEITDLLRDLENRERQIVLPTGIEGRRQLEEAMQQELQRQVSEMEIQREAARTAVGISTTRHGGLGNIRVQDEIGQFSRNVFNESIPTSELTRPGTTLITGTGGETSNEDFAEMWNQAREDRVQAHTIPEGQEGRFIWGIDPYISQEREGEISDRDINYMRLQRGDITPLEYLDSISDEV